MPSTVSAFAVLLATWIDRLMPDIPRRSSLCAALTGRFAGRADPVTADTCAEVEAVAQQHSCHLMLSFDPAGAADPDEEATGWPPPDEADARRRAGAVTEVRRVDGATSIIRVDGLEPLRVAQPYLEAAFALTAGARRLVLDLRSNGGGDPATVAFICGWLLGGDSTQLSEVHYRDRRRQWWTPPFPAPRRLPASVPVAVLTGPATFSSGEALAYHLQARGRATIVGEPTRGGADHVTPVQLTPTVSGLLPEAYVIDFVTGGNWEGVGVQPDIGCAAERALTVAIEASR
jgi:hypothetical protein